MEVLIWVVVGYLAVAVLTFIGLCRRLVPLDMVALVTVVLMALVWPLTIAGR